MSASVSNMTYIASQRCKASIVVRICVFYCIAPLDSVTVISPAPEILVTGLEATVVHSKLPELSAPNT